jgi:predicted peptidase
MIRRLFDRLKLDPGERRQTAETFRRTVTREMSGRYLLYLPADYDASRRWPLILFLHGSGERGDDVSRVARHGPPKLLAAGDDLPCIVVSPQADSERTWSTWQLDALLEEVAERYAIDDARIYLTGLSLGGYGAWDLAMEFPRRFAALVPVSAQGNPSGVAALRHLPVWAFHGALDDVVPMAGARRMVDDLREAGGDVRFTVYPELGHDAWTRAYEEPALYEWMLAQRRG